MPLAARARPSRNRRRGAGPKLPLLDRGGGERSATAAAAGRPGGAPLRLADAADLQEGRGELAVPNNSLPSSREAGKQWPRQGWRAGRDCCAAAPRVPSPRDDGAVGPHRGPEPRGGTIPQEPLQPIACSGEEDGPAGVRSRHRWPRRGRHGGGARCPKCCGGAGAGGDAGKEEDVEELEAEEDEGDDDGEATRAATRGSACSPGNGGRGKPRRGADLLAAWSRNKRRTASQRRAEDEFADHAGRREQRRGLGGVGGGQLGGGRAPCREPVVPASGDGAPADNTHR